MKHINDKALELSLSLEEVVVLLNLMGQAQLARETLHALVGDISPDEERGRLLAANRSLLARGVFHLAGGELQIDPAYTRLLAPLADNHFVLRCAARRPEQPEEVLAFYVKDGLIVEQRIEYGVAHTFREVENLAGASAAGASFLDLSQVVDFDAEPFTLTGDQLEEARRLASAETGPAQTYLRDLGLNKEAVSLFVDDLAHQRRRGSAVRLEIDHTAGTVRDSGFLSLVGDSGRVWLFTTQAGENGPVVLVSPANLDRVRQSLELALAPLAAN
jgi:hypothetical protein